MSKVKMVRSLVAMLPSCLRWQSILLRNRTAAPQRVRADLPMARYRSAMGGNAQNKMIKQVGAAAAELSRVPARAPSKPTKAPKLGKKEERALAGAGAVQTDRLAPMPINKIAASKRAKAAIAAALIAAAASKTR